MIIGKSSWMSFVNTEAPEFSLYHDFSSLEITIFFQNTKDDIRAGDKMEITLSSKVLTNILIRLNSTV